MYSLQRNSVLLFFLVLIVFATACEGRQNDSVANGTGLDSNEIDLATYEIGMDKIEGTPSIVCTSEKSIYYWLPTGDELYRGGSTITLCKLDIETNNNTTVQLPYGEGWKLDAMHRDNTNGFWMVFSKVLSTSSVHTGDNYGDSILVRTDANLNEVFCVELSEYASECVSILGHVYNTESEYVQDLMDEMGYRVVHNKSFAGAKLACDAKGNVYVTSKLQDVIAFDETGGFLGQFAIYNYEYADDVRLVETKSGSVVAACYREAEHYYVKLNVEDCTVGNPIFSDVEDKWNNTTPVVTLLSQYDLFEVGTDCLYGVKLEDSEYSKEKIADIDENMMPGCYGVTFQSLTMASNNELSGGKFFIFLPRK